MLMPQPEQSHVARLRKQGLKLKQANIACKGVKNDKGQFYKCVAAQARKIFDGSK